jgi:P27 family predicted phage terminase small subunit
MRGRKPKPNHLKVVEGTFRADRAHPERDAALRPVRLTAPSWLSEAEVEVFDEVAAHLHHVGVSTVLDADLVSLYAGAVVRYRHAHDVLRRMAAKDAGAHGILVQATSGGVKRNPVLSVVRQEAAEVTRLGSELGLSPVARIRLGVGTTHSDPGDVASTFFT